MLAHQAHEPISTPSMLSTRARKHAKHKSMQAHKGRKAHQTRDLAGSCKTIDTLGTC